jgi:hypothetical protein
MIIISKEAVVKRKLFSCGSCVAQNYYQNLCCLKKTRFSDFQILVIFFSGKMEVGRTTTYDLMLRTANEESMTYENIKKFKVHIFWASQKSTA